ncbi:MAG: hypothetical protein J6W25_02365 [Bacilli bacterium]|nr:hypothetical protein [Bacilli bacterium]MBO7536353.1 hypothetical protein [Bacilli bacterium]
MDKLVSVFRKIARLLTIILLFVLAAFELVALVGSFGDGFMGAITGITMHLLLTLLYGAPAVLLLVKKDKEALITLSFIIGYLFINAVLTFINYGILIDADLPALTVIYGIVAFSLGLAYAFVLICFLLEKVFGLKLMKIGFIVLIFSLVLLFVLLILQVIMAIKNDSFDWFVNNITIGIIVPLVLIFGLMLLDDNGK